MCVCVWVFVLVCVHLHMCVCVLCVCVCVCVCGGGVGVFKWWHHRQQTKCKQCIHGVIIGNTVKCAHNLLGLYGTDFSSTRNHTTALPAMRLCATPWLPNAILRACSVFVAWILLLVFCWSCFIWQGLFCLLWLWWRTYGYGEGRYLMAVVRDLWLWWRKVTYGCSEGLMAMVKDSVCYGYGQGR